MAAFCFVCSSVVLIASLTWSSGVVVAGLTGAEHLDDVPAELRLDRIGEIARLRGEDELVERRDRAALERGELAAVGLRGRVLRVLLRELREVRAALDLVVELLSPSASFFTRMWRTSREAGCWYWVGFLS